MSHRRTATTAGARTDIKAERVPVQEPLTLDGTNSASVSSSSAASGKQNQQPLSIEDRYANEKLHAKRRHWKESPFAVGLVAPTWAADKDDETVCCMSHSHSEDDNDAGGCMCCSGFVCNKMGAGRVGNMAILSQTMEWVEHVEKDEETGEEVVHKVQRPRLLFVVGPYWPMLLFVTYPLIFGVSLLTLFKGIPGKHPALVLFWAICTGGLVYALFKTSFSDPGILYRHEKPPPQDENSWRWSDQAQSYRPRGAYYDPDCAVVVEDFDHTCPWTGTAIGKGNMPYFQAFVSLIFFCLLFDILLLTQAL